MSLRSRIATPLLQNTGSTARDHLASERTFLAWIRTGLGFIALGIAVERFSQLDLESLVHELRPSTPDDAPPKHKSDEAKSREQMLVGALLGTGSGSIIYGTTRYFTNMRLLERGQFKPTYHGAAILSISCAAMAGAAYWQTMRHGEQRLQHSRK